MFKSVGKIRFLYILMALLGAVLLLAATACGDDDEDEGAAAKATITFADLDWDSAQIQNAIARRIVEDGYGYPTDAIFGGTIPLWQGLVGGDIDVTMEIWLPNQKDVWEPAMAKGQVIPVGKSLDDNWQSAFVVPAYVVERTQASKQFRTSGTT